MESKTPVPLPLPPEPDYPYGDDESIFNDTMHKVIQWIAAGVIGFSIFEILRLLISLNKYLDLLIAQQ
jgi:hypothetical protein